MIKKNSAQSATRNRAASGNTRMRDVAKLSGVSTATISRALNNPESVTKETLKLVNAAIKELNYIPNQMAGNLSSNRSKIIAVIIPSITNSIYTATVDSLSQILNQHGYQLLLGQTQFQPEEELRLIDAFLGRRVDGIVLIPSSPALTIKRKLKNVSIPIVQAWETPIAPIDMCAGYSNFDAGYAVGEYLFNQGYKHLAYIGTAELRSLERLEGLKLFAEKNKLSKVHVEMITAPGTFENASEAVANILKKHKKNDAVFCANDIIAAGALFECQRQHIAVPAQLAIMGFADLPIAAQTQPAISTVHIPAMEIGIAAGEMILNRLNDTDQKVKKLKLDFQIIQRSTT